MALEVSYTLIIISNCFLKSNGQYLIYCCLGVEWSSERCWLSIHSSSLYVSLFRSSSANVCVTTGFSDKEKLRGITMWQEKLIS